MNKFLKRANELYDSMIKDRRFLHANAELSDELPITTEYVMKRLTEIGLNPKEITKSGICALIEGKSKEKSGKTILIRSDMDALPMAENNNLEFKSKKDISHTCGHDMHSAMAIAAAQILKENENELEGTVKFMFQPAEETFKGSLSMIEAGILENPKVDAAIAIHLMLDSNVPSVSYGAGYMTSSCDGFKITIKGKGCHGAMPHLGIDPINVGVHIYSSFQELISRETPPSETASLSIGSFQSGTTNNIIPEIAVLQGTLRTYNKELRKKLVQRMKEIADLSGKMFNAKVEYEILSAVPATYTNPELLNELIEYLDDLNMEKHNGYRITPSDDIAFLSEKVPFVYFMLGAHVEGNDYPHHNPNVLFDENAMPYGAAIHAQCAFNFLKKYRR